MKVLEQKEYAEAIKKPDAVLIAMLGKCKFFDDSVRGVCDKCHRTIHFRPYNREVTHKLCIECAEEMLTRRMEIEEFLKEPMYHG